MSGGAAGGRQPASPDGLSEAQAAVYWAILTGPRVAGPRHFEMINVTGQLLGPFHAMVAYPEVGGPMQSLGAALRFDSSLSGGAREVAILTVAAALGSDYEWYAHAAIARSIGIPEHVVDELRTGRRPRELNDEERCAGVLAGRVVRRERPSSEERAEFDAILRARGVFEVVALVGYYSMLANVLDVMDPPLPESMTRVFG